MDGERNGYEAPETGGGGGVFVTPEEAEKAGLEMCVKPPAPTRCEFCGGIVQSQGIRLGRAVVCWDPAPRCGCEKAREYWALFDRREAEKRAKEEEERKKREEAERLRRLIARAGIGERYARASFDGFVCSTPEQAKCRDIVRDYAENFETFRAHGRGLYLEGTNGTGKTHLASAAVIELIGRGYSAVFSTAGAVLEYLKSRYDGDRDGGVYSRFLDPDLLVIDDLGKERATEWSASVFYEIIDGRYNALKPTVITTNYNDADLISALTPPGTDATRARAVLSRLHETNSRVTMAWPDIRRRAVPATMTRNRVICKAKI